MKHCFIAPSPHTFQIVSADSGADGKGEGMVVGKAAL